MPKRYMVSPVYDWAFFLLPPLVALALGIFISGSDFSDRVFDFAGQETTVAELGLGALIHAHLVAVVFRSHTNGAIFRLYPIRFIWIPLVLWLAIVSSAWIAITATVVATFWDVWHSGAQTFGFARIYDRNAGVPPKVARNLDLWLNQLLYAGPILAGVSLADHVDVFERYESIGATFFTAIPAQASGAQQYFFWAVLGLGTAFIAYYVFAHIRLYRQGHHFSPLKVYLIASTGLCSIYTWGFNTWGEAFFIMNLFHAVQYVALVWAVEHKRMSGLFGVGKVGTALIFFAAILGYGFGAQILDPGLTTLWAVTIVVSLMHFWYDGFVWSVKKGQV